MRVDQSVEAPSFLADNNQIHAIVNFADKVSADGLLIYRRDITNTIKMVDIILIKQNFRITNMFI